MKVFKIEFIDVIHKKYYRHKLKELGKYGKTDVYYRSLTYILSMCETTREHFASIFDIENGLININAVTAPYQTSTSAKVTRIAFSLWNRCNYDSEEDIENNIVSSHYNPSEIFCCSYAPYFYQGIRIRYPEYTERGV